MRVGIRPRLRAELANGVYDSFLIRLKGRLRGGPWIVRYSARLGEVVVVGGSHRNYSCSTVSSRFCRQ